MRERVICSLASSTALRKIPNYQGRKTTGATVAVKRCMEDAPSANCRIWNWMLYILYALILHRGRCMMGSWADCRSGLMCLDWLYHTTYIPPGGPDRTWWMDSTTRSNKDDWVFGFVCLAHSKQSAGDL